MALTARFQSESAEPLQLSAAGQSFALPRDQLGVHVDAAELAASAFQVGRQGSILDWFIVPFALRLEPRRLDARPILNDAGWTTALQPVEDAVARPPLDAQLILEDDGQVSMRPERDGARLNLAAARERISAALLAGSGPTVKLPLEVVPARVRSADLAAARQQAAAILSGPVTVQVAGASFELSSAAIRAGLTLPSGPGQAVSVDPAVIHGFVGQVARAVDQPARDARLVLEGDQVVEQPSQPARALDPAATAELVQAALGSTNRTIVPVVQETDPTVRDADLQAQRDLANLLIGTPVVLQGPGGANLTLTAADLRGMLVLPSAPADQRSGPIHLDGVKLGARIADAAQIIDRPALNARFQRRPNGGVAVSRDGVAGYRVDQASALRLVEAAARSTSSKDRTVPLPIVTTPPSITASDAPRIAGLALVADNLTSYAGSIPPRKHNVELATSFVNGAVVAPGEIFSFNQELGPTTLTRGFQVGYGIEAQSNGAVETVPSVAGGICQVATTLFQPLFWEGYAIEERYAHAYYIAHYRSRGVPGLDTTVDPDTGLDFRFKNDTASPMLIQATTDGSNVRFAIYGDKPTWTVKVDPPVISNLVKTDRTPILQPDPTMPIGQQVVTEAAEDGFTVTIKRTVIDGSGKERVLDLRSVYAPAHNVTAVGTKK